MGRGDRRVRADAAGAHELGGIGVRVGRWVAAVLGESHQYRYDQVWDVATGACVQTLQGHTSWVWSVCVSADGSQLFSGSQDDTIKVWDVATGACVQTLQGHGVVNSVCVSTTGRGCSRGVQTTRGGRGHGRCVQTLQGHPGEVFSVCVSADGRGCSREFDKTIKVWDVGRARACRRCRDTQVRWSRCACRPMGRGCSLGVRQGDQGVGRGDGRVRADTAGTRIPWPRCACRPTGRGCSRGVEITRSRCGT